MHLAHSITLIGELSGTVRLLDPLETSSDKHESHNRDETTARESSDLAMHGTSRSPLQVQAPAVAEDDGLGRRLKANTTSHGGRYERRPKLDSCQSSRSESMFHVEHLRGPDPLIEYDNVRCLLLGDGEPPQDRRRIRRPEDQQYALFAQEGVDCSRQLIG